MEDTVGSARPGMPDVGPHPDHIVIAESADFATTAAAAIARLLTDAIAEREVAHVALAGGSTPRPVYEHLAQREDVSWAKLQVYFGDERAVSPDDPASNYKMAHETLLRHVPIRPGQVHRMEAERENLEAAAADYARLLPKRLDLVLLGIGEDGHTASLFPGSAALAEKRRMVLPVDGPKPPTKRLTITPEVITNARATLVMAAGRGKAAAVARALEGPYDAAACPAQLARGGVWILDLLAAARLETSQR